MQWSVVDLVRATGGQVLYRGDDDIFDGIGIDSRIVKAHMVFVALRGENHDGHRFIDRVVAKGVRGVVVERAARVPLDHEVWRDQGVTCVAVDDTLRALGALAAYQRSRFRIPLVAITGSNGKTTTRQMAAQVMEQKYRVLATQGNLNNEIGLPLTLFNLSETHQAAVVELGMNHAGEIDRLGAICRPTIGMITNVGPAHLEFLGSMEAVAKAKEELVGHIETQGHVVLNRDDPYVFAMASSAPCPATFFGTHPEAHVRAEAIETRSRGTAFTLVLPEQQVPVQLNVTGRFMVSNALAAAAVGHLAGIEGAQIKAALEAFQPVGGRLAALQLKNGVNVIDDTYNANPASMAAAFESFAELKGPARGYIILGDMLELGAQAAPLHRQVGELAAQSGPDGIYAYGEYAESVVQGARSAGMSENSLFSGSKSAIAADVIQRLVAGDWVLIKGSRGSAMETVVEAIGKWSED
ncbi:MAG: UDP-N-acetylmuramoyl-tripeptide--D-alanyl-D-alanine ligase [Desulfobacteraceae bacterium]|jgi:UDP-N-acetylmuramoyl-tripeptide--D-alanyl-D-alanine ligase